MADYERLVKELNTKLRGQDDYAEELKAQINTLTHKEDTLKQEIGTFVLDEGLMNVMVASKCKNHLSKYLETFFKRLLNSPFACACECCVCPQRI